MKTSSAALDYAKIFFEVCQDRDIVDEVLYDAKSLQKITDEEIITVLSVPTISKQQKKDLLDELPATGIHSEVVNLMKILVDNNQLHIFGDILEAYQNIYQEKNDIQIVHIITARDLSGEMKTKIREMIEKRINKFVVVIQTIEPKIIGGIRIEYDGKVIDNTVVKQLKQLEKNFS